MPQSQRFTMLPLPNAIVKDITFIVTKVILQEFLNFLFILGHLNCFNALYDIIRID